MAGSVLTDASSRTVAMSRAAAAVAVIRRESLCIQDPCSGESRGSGLACGTPPQASTRAPSACLVERNLPLQVEAREHLARAEDDRRERILGHLHGEARLAAEPPIEVLQQRAATAQHDAAVADVGRTLRENPDPPPK